MLDNFFLKVILGNYCIKEYPCLKQIDSINSTRKVGMHFVVGLFIIASIQWFILICVFHWYFDSNTFKIGAKIHLHKMNMVALLKSTIEKEILWVEIIHLERATTAFIIHNSIGSGLSYEIVCILVDLWASKLPGIKFRGPKKF